MTQFLRNGSEECVIQIQGYQSAGSHPDHLGLDTNFKRTKV